MGQKLSHIPDQAFREALKANLHENEKYLSPRKLKKLNVLGLLDLSETKV